MWTSSARESSDLTQPTRMPRLTAGGIQASFFGRALLSFSPHDRKTALPDEGHSPERAPRTRRPMRVARIAGVVLLLVIALPGIAGGVYAVAAKELPENLPAWLGSSPEITFTVLGIVGCIVGAATLALSLALIVWPEKALSAHAPLGRLIGRLLRRRR